MSKYWSHNETGATCNLTFISKDNLLQNILSKTKKSNKVRQYQKGWYLFLQMFWAQVPKNYFCMEEWALGCVPMQFWDITDISAFPRTLSLESFGNTSDNSWIRFLILDIKFSFAKFQVIISKNSGSYVRKISLKETVLKNKTACSRHFYWFITLLQLLYNVRVLFCAFSIQILK